MPKPTMVCCWDIKPAEVLELTITFNQWTNLKRSRRTIKLVAPHLKSKL
jgi:hypothetical protein